MLAKNTKKALRSVALRTLLAFGAVASVMSMVGPADAAEAITGIRTTRHNLSATNNIAGANKVTNTGGEICVFCHTPHGSSTTSAAPLWNKKIMDAATYTVYTSSTLDGTVDLGGSVSLGCLTCHDGTQAMDTVLNSPGSGGYNATGARMLAADGVSNLTWAGNAAGTGKIGNTITNLGNDLSNDHPVGIPYAKPEGITALDPDFVQATKITKASGNIWYVETSDRGWTNLNANAKTGKDKYDMILYSKSGVPYVECASCHDPHTDNTTFLRIPNDGSQVCLSCHNK